MLDRVTIGRMCAWAAGKPILLALSGGGDSVAMLHLLVAELGVGQVRAAIVDHALREGSPAAAARAKAFAEALGVRAEILTLSWPAGSNRAQQAAREARYRALCDYARRENLNTIATAHTADDQAETVMMRAANGSTWRGLAGIAPFASPPLWPEGRGIALARPLLGARRAELRLYLHERGAPWIEDAANADPTYERVRVRQRMGALEAEGFDPAQLARLATRLRGKAAALDRAALDLIERAAKLDLTIAIKRSEWIGSDGVRQRALSVLIAAAAGAAREPTGVEKIERRVMSLDHRGSTYWGVEFAPTKAGIELRREPGAALGRADGAPGLAPLPLSAGVEAIWDGRIAITALEPGWRVVPAPNRELAAFEKDAVRKRYREAGVAMQLRPLAAERVAHAFAPDINRAKP